MSLLGVLQRLSGNYTAINNPMLLKKKEKLTFYKAVFIYMLGGIVGTIWETTLNLCKGKGFVFCNGSIFTPFNFVYGFGALFIVICLHNRSKLGQVYFIGAVGGGVVEYVLSFLEENLLGTRSWDYSDLPTNINGRTTLLYMVFWGLLCVFVIFIIYHPLNRWLDKIPKRVMKVVAIVMFVILAIDLLITVMAILRYSGRSSGSEAFTPIERLMDRWFSDEFMELRFPNLSVNGE